MQSLLGFCRYKAQTYLAEAAKKGKVEVKKFKVLKATGFTSMVPHYRLLE